MIGNGDKVPGRPDCAAFRRMMPNTSKKHILESGTLLLYATLLAVVSYYHEPWFDEAQAWLIARDSSLFDMIWHVMRYEGHTPLWHLALFIPAHLGLPFELGLKTVGFIFAALSAFVFIRYSPFPLAIRLLTPFTYFLFYQYGVISRCYAPFMLVLWIIAAVFPKRNERPLLFSILLALLGGIMAYGMLIAFGIALAWLIEIIQSRRPGMRTFLSKAASVFSDRRLRSIALLGLINVIWPMQDKYTAGLEYGLTIADRIYRLFVAPVGALFLGETDAISAAHFQSVFSIFVALVGVFLIAAYIIWSLHKGIFYYAVLPYAAMTAFMAFVYFSMHHTGIYTLLLLFVFWISFAGTGRPGVPPRKHTFRIFPNFLSAQAAAVKKAGIMGLACFFSLQLYWTVSASKNDILLPYAPYRQLSRFIHKIHIDTYKIFDYYYLSNNRNIYLTADVGALAYFPDNIFYNHNPFHHEKSYALHRRFDDEKLGRILKASGPPDFIFWHKEQLPLYNDLFSLSDYLPVKAFESFYMWKDTLNPDSIIIFMRKDLLSKFPGIAVADD
jgi:hypothetical protein